MTATQKTMERLDRMFDPLASESVYLESPMENYDALPGINASVLKKPTPLEMLAALEKTEDRLKYAFQFGTLVHMAVLEPDKFETNGDRWIVRVSTKSLDTKEGRAVFEANTGKVVATAAMIEKAARARDAAWRHLQFRELMEAGVYRELSYQAWDESHGLWRKGLVDFAPKDDSDWLGDLKTTSISLAETWRLNREAKDRGYDFSAAHYSWLHNKLAKQDVGTYLLVWLAGPAGEYADASEPWMCRMTAISRFPDDPKEDFSLSGASTRVTKALQRFIESAQTNEWTAYETERIAL